ncbi:M56 family metallopeptidase [Stenotrophomonas mori]|uniref:M56 family metallopeptidase n=1 Tax=Stenotrophomonas mori TaxID=2871096 RepID=A0ABT0SKL0_9GAMM|nr:M56 family metallopeptidase [Stenotrophomonas mori]MCL7715872.1 M56 family metallopeptidase [Stenotrophomonas mori]
MHTVLELLGNRLLATSVQTMLLTALVWLLCRCVRRLPAATQCGLWWLVALQAVLGLLWAVPLELPVLPAPDVLQTVPQAVAAAPAAVAPRVVMTPLPLESGWSWLHLAMALWLAGVLVMALRTASAWRASRALLRAALPCDDHRLDAALQLAADAHGLRRAPRLMLSTAIDSPQLVGPWRPVLLLPARVLQRMGDDDLDMALTHELVHLQRHDLWWGLVPALAQHLFFFHPLVHLAAREYAIAREAAVDAAVVAGDRHCRQHYGRLLLQLGVSPRPGAGLASASPTFLSLKRRLLMLQNTSSFPRVGAGLIVAAVALVGVLPMRLVAMPAPPAPASVPVPASTVSPPPALPVVEAAAEVPVLPVPPSPPAAPAAQPLSVEGRLRLSQSPGEDGYVLLMKEHSIMNGSTADLEQARRLDDGKGVLLLRRGGRAYVVRDAGVLTRFQQAFVESTRLGKEQGRLGERQGRLGERQGAIGTRMGEVGERIGALAARQAEQALAAQADGDHEAMRRAADAARREAEKLRAELGTPAVRAEMQDLARQQAELGRQQAQLGRRQVEASARAQREAEQLIQQALRDGLAQAVDG